MIWKHRLLAGGIAIGATCSGALAQASPETDDVRTSDSIYFSSGHLTIDGRSVSEGHRRLSKTAGTLDVRINARSIGLDFDAVLDLTGRVVGNRVVWSFDHHLSEGYEIGLWTHVTRVRGELIATPRIVEGETTPDCRIGLCEYNVRLDGESSSWVEISGTGPFWTSWSKRSTSIGFDLLAGHPQPPLRAMGVNTPARLCVSDRDRYYAGRVELEATAPAGGVSVQVFSDNAAVFPERQVEVRDGRRTGAFFVKVPAHYSGTLNVLAATGGFSDMQTIRVAPAWQCNFVSYRVIDILPRENYPCLKCLDRLTLANDGSAAVRYDGRWLSVDSAGKATDVTKKIRNPIHDVIPAFYGELWGIRGEKLRTFRFDPDVGKREIISSFHLSAVGGSGVAVGEIGGQRKRRAGYFDGEELVDMGVGLGSRVEVIGSNSVVAGTYPGEQGNWRAFASFGDEVFDLGVSGQDLALTGASATGEVVGWVTQQGYTQSFVFSGEKLERYELKPPWGQKQVVAVGIDDSGAIVANAVSSKGKPQGVYLYYGGEEAVQLEQLLGDGRFDPIEVLQMTAGGDMVVRGYYDGELTLVRLAPKLDFDQENKQ